VLRLIGVEVSTDAGHIVGLDLPPTPMRFGRDPVEVFRQIEQLGGFALAAHPDADRAGFAWSGWPLAGYEGIEVFNSYSAYRRQGVLKSLAYLFLSPFWETSWLTWQLDWDPVLLDTWSQALAERKLSIWTGVDAHGGIDIVGEYAVPWPSYERLFRTARNYLLLEEPLNGVVRHDRGLIYGALRDGRGYVALDDYADARGFRFWGEASDRRWPMGSDIVFDESSEPVMLRATIPAQLDAELRFFLDGVPLAATRTGALSTPVDRPGVYRAEARLGVRRVGAAAYKPWILSNPISILPQAVIEDRLEANRVPSPPSLPGDAELDRGSALRFQAERNSGCRAMEVRTVGSGERSFRASFDLGVPEPGAPADLLTPFARCAAADRSSRDLSGYSGIRFRTRADAIYRVSLELHDPNPRSSADGMEPWTVSFLTSQDWQEVVVPFDRFRSAGPGSDGLLDLADIGAMLFLFDTWNARPGTAGVIEVEGFSFWVGP